MRFVRDRDGALVGAGWVDTLSPYVETSARGRVAPHRLGQGIGSFLLDWQTAVARERVAMAPDGARVALVAFADPDHEPSAALLTDRGFDIVRFFLEMYVGFDQRPPAPPPLPDGLRLAVYDPDTDLGRVFGAVDEAFRDHFGYVERPRDEEFARFSSFMEIASFDPDLAWMVLDGDEVVGVNICLGDHEGDSTIGYVGNLAVRRRWRGRGLATTMLAVCFDEFARRGKVGAALHVDADSRTGATRLYESVGMREVHREALYELELRPGKNLTLT